MTVDFSVEQAYDPQWQVSDSGPFCLGPALVVQPNKLSLLFAGFIPDADLPKKALAKSKIGGSICMSVSKRTRFEVLKRDKFTCQYCGRRAPEVVLHVDHVKPSARSGSNQLTNLMTACVDCNLGKSDKVIDPTDLLRDALCVVGYFKAIDDGIIPAIILENPQQLRQSMKFWRLLEDLAAAGTMPYPRESDEEFELRRLLLGLDPVASEEGV